MKKKESKKFSLEKFEVAKLNNSITINGGTGEPVGSSIICTTTNTNDPNTSEDCKHKPKVPHGPQRPRSTNAGC